MWQFASSTHPTTLAASAPHQYSQHNQQRIYLLHVWYNCKVLNMWCIWIIPCFSANYLYLTRYLHSYLEMILQVYLTPIFFYMLISWNKYCCVFWHRLVAILIVVKEIVRKSMISSLALRVIRLHLFDASPCFVQCTTRNACNRGVQYHGSKFSAVYPGSSRWTKFIRVFYLHSSLHVHHSSTLRLK